MIARLVKYLPIACPYCVLNSKRGETGCTCGYLRELDRAAAPGGAK